MLGCRRARRYGQMFLSVGISVSATPPLEIFAGTGALNSPRPSCDPQRSASGQAAGQYQGALNDSNAAIPPEVHIIPQAHINLGIALSAEKRNGEAVVAFTDALALNPSHPEIVYFDRALAREDSGDMKGAYLDLSPGVAACAATCRIIAEAAIGALHRRPHADQLGLLAHRLHWPDQMLASA